MRHAIHGVPRRVVAPGKQVVPLDERRNPKFLLDPERHRLQKRAESFGAVGEVGLQDTLELNQRLFVEDDMGEICIADPRLLQAVSDRMMREGSVMLLAREAFLLRGGNDLAIPDEASGRIVVIEREAKYICIVVVHKFPHSPWIAIIDRAIIPPRPHTRQRIKPKTKRDPYRTVYQLSADG